MPPAEMLNLNDVKRLLSFAEMFKATEFKEFLLSVPVELQATFLERILDILTVRRSKEAFEFVLRNIPNLAEMVEKILTSRLVEIY